LIDFSRISYLFQFHLLIQKKSLSDYQLNSNNRKNSNHNGFNSAYELEDDAENDDLFKIKNRKNSHKSNINNTSIGTNGADHSFDEISHNSSSASSRLNSNMGNGQQFSSQPELLITSPNKYTNYYNSNHNLVNTSRARLAQENLQRLEKEKDDLYEL
jgi:hypothetical protein